MNNAYAVHFWSSLYQEEALRETNRRHLAQRIEAGKGPRQSGRLVLALRSRREEGDQRGPSQGPCKMVGRKEESRM